MFEAAQKGPESNHFFYAYAHFGLFRVLEKMRQQGYRKVYLPAFICDVVTLAIRQADLSPQYYAVDSSFQIVWPSLRKVSLGEIFITVNYFGLQTDMAKARNFCRKKNLLWINDNSHGFACRNRNQDLEKFGDVSLTSFRKVLPICNGAVVNINNPKLRILLSHHLMADRELRAEPGKWKFTTKKLFRQILPWVGRLPDFTKPCKPTTRPAIAYKVDPKARGHFLRANKNRIRTIRRQNYQALLALWKQNKYKFGKPVVKDLPPGSSPLVFPLRIPNSKIWRAFLRTAREENLDAHSWPTLPAQVSRKYIYGAKRIWATTVLLPVHQKLATKDLLERVIKIAQKITINIKKKKKSQSNGSQ